MNTPHCIGFIMDGNRRWAHKRNLPVIAGHRAGKQKAREVLTWLNSAGVEWAVFYAFSTENWKRDKREVSSLVRLLEEFIQKDVSELDKENIRIRFVGDRTTLPQELQKAMLRAETKTEQNTGGTIALAFSYGGRAEITQAVQSLVEHPPKREVKEEDIKKHLWTSGIPDPDLIIRTGGEKRLSNFLPWQSVYSELAFCDTYWPDFSEEEFNNILQWYAARDRRNGT